MTPRPKPDLVAMEVQHKVEARILFGEPEHIERIIRRALWQERTAALREAREIARLQNNYIDTNTGKRQQWVRDQIVEKIERLIEPETRVPSEDDNTPAHSCHAGCECEHAGKRRAERAAQEPLGRYEGPIREGQQFRLTVDALVVGADEALVLVQSYGARLAIRPDLFRAGARPAEPAR